jgi:hypothetical protein
MDWDDILNLSPEAIGRAAGVVVGIGVLYWIISSLFKRGKKN